MLFSNPDYPVFLIAVFFLYALSRHHGWARAAVMVVLGDLVFVLVAKDTAALWDPLGGLLLRLVAERGGDYSAPPGELFPLRWLVGTGVLAAAIAIGARRGTWIA